MYYIIKEFPDYSREFFTGRNIDMFSLSKETAWDFKDYEDAENRMRILERTIYRKDGEYIFSIVDDGSLKYLRKMERTVSATKELKTI